MLIMQISPTGHLCIQLICTLHSVQGNVQKQGTIKNDFLSFLWLPLEVNNYTLHFYMFVFSLKGVYSVVDHTFLDGQLLKKMCLFN